jgi:hypothetical protein
MSPVERHLHLVRTSPAEGEGPAKDRDDVGITLMLFLLSALPPASALAGVGRWSQASLGLGTLGVLLAGRELGALLLARCRRGGHR